MIKNIDLSLNIKYKYQDRKLIWSKNFIFKKDLRKYILLGNCLIIFVIKTIYEINVFTLWDNFL